MSSVKKSILFLITTSVFFLLLTRESFASQAPRIIHFTCDVTRYSTHTHIGRYVVKGKVVKGKQVITINVSCSDGNSHTHELNAILPFTVPKIYSNPFRKPYEGLLSCGKFENSYGEVVKAIIVICTETIRPAKRFHISVKSLKPLKGFRYRPKNHPEIL